MASKKTGVDGLTIEIKKILQAYGDDVAKDVAQVVKKTGQKAAKALRQESRAKFGTTKDYAYSRSWTSTAQLSRQNASSIVYSKIPSRPHLLERGHAKRNGGRVPGRAHIAPVEAAINTEFQREVEKII